MSLPVRLAVAGAVTATAVLLSRRRGSRQRVQPVALRPSSQLQDKQQEAPQQLDAPPSPALPGRARLYIALLISLLATLLATCAAAASVWRGSVDVAAVIVLAWCLVILQKAVTVNGGMQGRPVAAVPSRTEPEEAAVELPDMSGVWMKDAALSDSMEPAMQLLRLNGIMRTAVRLIRGLNLELDGPRFSFGVFSVISWFKITERFELGGPSASHKRRDLRRGRCIGSARGTRKGTILLQYEWGEPYAGCGTDEFELGEDGRLRVHTILHVGGQSVRYTQVYNRKE